jgi:hypothetical protein
LRKTFTVTAKLVEKYPPPGLSSVRFHDSLSARFNDDREDVLREKLESARDSFQVCQLTYMFDENDES